MCKDSEKAQEGALVLTVRRWAEQGEVRCNVRSQDEADERDYDTCGTSCTPCRSNR